MRRILIIGTALAVLGVVVSTALAAAAGNHYTATYAFAPGGAGSKAKPKPVKITLTYTAQNNDSSKRTEPIRDVTTAMYGVIATTKGLPKCTLAFIAANTDAGCPPRALVATGYIHAAIGPSLSKSVPATIPDCHPILNVWYSGPGKLTFYFVAPQNQSRCSFVHTGQTPPYPGVVKQVGKYLVIDAQIPNAVTFPVGFYGSLSFEHLVWAKDAQASVACMGHKRPVVTTFTSEPSKSGPMHKSTVTYSAAC